MTIGSFFRSAYPGPGLVVLKKSWPSIWGERKVPKYPEGNFSFFVGGPSSPSDLSQPCHFCAVHQVLRSLCCQFTLELWLNRAVLGSHFFTMSYLGLKMTTVAGKAECLWLHKIFVSQQIYLAYPFLRLKRTFSMNSAEYSACGRGNLK